MHYTEDIKNHIPLTKDIIWQQVKRDYGFTDEVEGARIKKDERLQEDMKYIVEEMAKNRKSNSPVGRRFITEYNYRKQIRELLTTGYFEDYVDSLGS